ncbi:MAG: cupin [Limisphaerales bacterium]
MKTALQLPQAFAEVLNYPHIETFLLQDDGTFPNSRLPMIIFRSALKVTGTEAEATFKKLFAQHDWGNNWAANVYDFHHYHSTTHEVLGVAAGEASLQFGGEDGVGERIAAGDVIIIPAGVAHKNNGCTQDFTVVGGYPEGRDWDLNKGLPGERPRVDENIAKLPLPKSDPVYGAEGPLLECWSSR